MRRMKINLTLLILLLTSKVIFCQTLQDLKSEFEFRDLLDVDMILEHSFASVHGETGIRLSDINKSGEWNDEKRFEFDEDGNIVKMIYHRPSLIPYNTWEFGFSNTEPKNTNLQKIVRELDYDEYGKIIIEEVTVGNLTLDPSGEEEIDTTKIRTTIEYSYDDRQQLAQKIERAANGHMIGEEYFEYLENGQLGRYTKGDFSIEDWCDYNYNAEGLLLRKSCSRPGEQIRRIMEYEYEEGFVTNRIIRFLGKGEEPRKVIWSLRDGYVLKMEYMDKDGDTLEELEIFYSFDTRGNWIRKEIEGLRSKYITEREITYRK